MRLIFRLFLYLTIFLCLGISLGQLVKAAPPANFQTNQIIGSGLTNPTGFGIAPDGRIFVLERAGSIKIYKNGALLSAPFAILPAAISGDRGLIGITFDPDFATNHLVYFYYTDINDLHNKLVRFDASSDVAPGLPVIIYETSTPSELLHVGGSIQFGPDNKLYISIGDNGYSPNAQDLTNAHGKIIRINKDGSVPSDNPFVGQAGKLPEIWAYGLRNPFRFQFDSATGKLYVGDVGNSEWEEINVITKAGNYGWPNVEGNCTSSCPYINPLYTYPHNNQSSSVTQGPIYSGSMFPQDYQGRVFFADYAMGFIKTLTLNPNGSLGSVQNFDLSAGSVVDLKVAPDGSLYYITFFPGRLYRISYSLDNHTPVANAGSDVTKGIAPFTVNFTSAGSFDPDSDPLTYVWDFGDGTTSSTQANPVKTYTQNGAYTVQLTVSDGTNFAQAIPLVIQVGIPPTVTIGSPDDGDQYSAGQVINYTAFATDGAGFDIDDGDIVTEVLFHHGTHIHPFLGPIPGRNGQFTIPDSGETDPNVWYEIRVTATDTNGLSTTKTVSIYPIKVQLTITTNPAGLGVILDGQPRFSPYTFESVVEMKREINAPSLLEYQNRAYQFNSWSDGGAQKHFITTPTNSITFTALYSQTSELLGEYFDNKDLIAPSVLTRVDPAIDFDWDRFSPDPSLPDDNFSVRWTKNQDFTSGQYDFTTRTDDGVRLWIDSTLLIDKWQDQGPTSYTVKTTLSAGIHLVKMEYYEAGGGAVASLNWSQVGGSPSGAYQAEYWNLGSVFFPPSFPTTAPNLTRNDPVIDFNWDRFSPGAPIGNDNFAVRWTKSVALNAGTYKFSTYSDDGIRIFLDSVKILDDWNDHGPQLKEVTTTVASGDHIIKVEYYEHGGGAIAEFDFIPTSSPTPTPTGTPVPEEPYAGKYWNLGNVSFPPSFPLSQPNLTRQDTVIDFNWDRFSPGAPINNDNFAVEWTKTNTFEDATYKFTTYSDDGIRVFIDSTKILDAWNDHGPQVDEVTVPISVGSHIIKVQYYEHGGGAVAEFSFVASPSGTPSGTPSPAITGFFGEYFDNKTLSGSPKFTRIDQLINFTWGYSSPAANFPSNDFSVRWTKQADFLAGNHTFRLTSDDGIRFLIDNQLLLDKWIDRGPTTDDVTINLSAGTHNLKIEYYENQEGAVTIFEEL